MSLLKAWLVLQLAAVAVHASNSVTFKEGIEGQSCRMQPFTFPSTSFAYKIIVIRPTKLAPSCSEDLIRISVLYVGGSCLDPRDNDMKGCPPSAVDPVIITGPASASGVVTPLNASDALCTQALARGEAKVMREVVHFDSGVVHCAPSPYGFFFIENGCPAGEGESVVTAILEYVDKPEATCASAGGGGFGRWPAALAAVVVVGAAAFGVAAVMGRRRTAAAGGVQMAPPPPGGSSIYPSQPAGYVPVHHPAPDGMAGAGAGRRQPATWYAGGKAPKEAV